MAFSTALMVIGATLSTSPLVQEAQFTPIVRVASVAPDAERPRLPNLTAAEAADPVQSLHAVTMRPSLAKRPAPLMALYASFAVLQSLDLCTTSAAISRGANEANPAMRPLAGTAVGAVAVKVLATAATIYFAERASKQSRKGAIVLMTAINVASAAIVMHNTRVAKRN